MKIGTKSLLFGGHQFILHPIHVFIAWWIVYGFPKDPRLWIAFIVHDWGYWGKPNIDGKEGETHPELGAKIMHRLFDKKIGKLTMCTVDESNSVIVNSKSPIYSSDWYNFTRFHSRSYATLHGANISKLCIADKLAFCVPPKKLYLLLVTLTGEIKEYMTTSRTKFGKEPYTNKSEWYDRVYDYMLLWAKTNKDKTNV